MANPLEKIQALDAIEKDIIQCIQSVGYALVELSKEKPVQRNVEIHTATFFKTLNNIENKLYDQINYLQQLSTTNAHEGSGYGSAKNLQMAWQRLNNIKARLKELEDGQNKYAKKKDPVNPAVGAAPTVPQPTMPQ